MLIYSLQLAVHKTQEHHGCSCKLQMYDGSKSLAAPFVAPTGRESSGPKLRDEAEA